MSQTLPPPLFDPFAPGFTDDPSPQYAALPSESPEPPSSVSDR